MEWKTIKVEKQLIAQIKNKYGLSLNKSLKAMLIESGDYIPDDKDTEQWDKYNHMINIKLSRFMSNVEERFNAIESQLR